MNVSQNSKRRVVMKNEYKITKSLIKSWAKEYHLHGAANIFWFVIWCTFCVVGILTFVFSLELQMDWIYTYFSAIIVLVALFKLFVSRFFVWSKRYKIYSTTYGVSEWTRTTEFLEEEIVVTDHTSVSKFKYSNIEKINEKDNLVLIFMKNNMGLRLYKDAFVEGSWQECKTLLENKCKSQ